MHKQLNPYRVIVSLLFVLLVSGMQSVIAADDASLNKIQMQAYAGDMQKQFELAEIYYRGDVVKRSYEKAFALYEKAAIQGHAESQHQMGYLYKHGLELVVKDNERAFAWFLKAAEQGHVPSQTKVALMYMQGSGVKKSKENYRLWSNRVLEKKGMIETEEERAAKAAKEARAKRKAEARRAAAAKREAEAEAKAKTPEPSAAKPVAVKPESAEAKSATEPKPKAAAPVRTPEEQKAWRREQARRLVEESNKNSIDWSEE